MNAVPLPYEGKSCVGLGGAGFRDYYGIALGAAHNIILDDKKEYSLTLNIAAGMSNDEYGFSGGAAFNF